MTGTARVLGVVFSVFSLWLAIAPGTAAADEMRTAGRSVLGYFVYPDWIFNKPAHYEFSPLVSNSDPLTQHPASWEGQDWDPAAWNVNWTPDIAIQKFYHARIFEKQYMDGKTPVVVLGPTFYKLSDLDRRRTVKLLVDQSEVFKTNAKSVKLVDWDTDDVIGTYTPKGLFLN